MWIAAKISRPMSFISRRSERRVLALTLVLVSLLGVHQLVIRNDRRISLKEKHLVQKLPVIDAIRGALQGLSNQSRVTVASLPDAQDSRIKGTALPIQAAAPGVEFNDKSLNIALSAKAVNRFVIVPAVIDKGYLELAINFYLASVVRLNLQRNTLFMCVHFESCEEAKKQGLPVFFYNVTVVEEVGDFNTRAFVQKAMVKHKLVRDIINLGFTALLCDLDMYWFRSPVEDVQRLCGPSCDFAIQKEADIGLNSGFMFVRPNNGSRAFYEALVAEIAVTTKDDQTLYNEFAQKHRRGGTLNFVELPADKYPDGRTYWTAGNRTLPPGPPCPSCLMVHNNWIVSTEAKVYRFKEHHMWHLDNDRYYSDPARKYITYSNPLPIRFWMKRGEGPPSEEFLALKSALGIAIATNRTLILPREFHVWRATEPLMGVLLVRHFHHVFKSIYRESTFLDNPNVPRSVSDKHCKGFRIENNFVRAHAAELLKEPTGVTFTPNDAVNGCTSTEVSAWLAQYEDKCNIVEFDFLYRAFSGFDQKKMNDSFEGNIKTGFEHAFYDQGRVLRIPPPADPLPL